MLEKIFFNYNVLHAFGMSISLKQFFGFISLLQIFPNHFVKLRWLQEIAVALTPLPPFISESHILPTPPPLWPLSSFVNNMLCPIVNICNSIHIIKIIWKTSFWTKQNKIHSWMTNSWKVPVTPVSSKKKAICLKYLWLQSWQVIKLNIVKIK